MSSRTARIIGAVSTLPAAAAFAASQLLPTVALLAWAGGLVSLGTAVVFLALSARRREKHGSS